MTMEKLICDTCGRKVIPVEGVTSVESRGYLWCAHCANITFANGSPIVNFPSKGKLLPLTLSDEEENG
jgi:hypothetical protein